MASHSDDEPSAELADDPPLPYTAVQKFLSVHCLSCHSGERPKAGLSLDYTTEDAVRANPSVWYGAAEAMRSGHMPPASRPTPDAVESGAIARWADSIAATAHPPRRVTARRLNQAEYANTVQALLGVGVRLEVALPADDTGDGFDTIGDVLSVSPTLIEKYLSASEGAVAAAVADRAVWERLRTPPATDPVPYAIRGAPPVRGEAVKGTDGTSADDDRAAEIDRTYYALQAFADRAYRRPVTHREMYRLMRFVETALDRGEPADVGLRQALLAVLASPHFLFRLEPDGGPAGRPLTGFEVATRLAYFLWASPPDDALYRAACADQLGDSKALATQVRRMVADPRARALADLFADQWLQIRGLDDTAAFPGVDVELRTAMRTETRLVFDDVARNNRPVLDLLTGEDTFVNQRLAEHYGIPGVTGEDFRRVSLAGTGRGGVLGHASVLTVTSGPARTSPVRRGKWVLETLLGASPGSPPPGVDSLKDEAGPATTARERLARHRGRAECAGCHARIDPLGFGLENFDRVGRWRDADAGVAVDAAGVLPDGRTFTGPVELRVLLAAKPDPFVRCLTRKLLTYALGRSLTPADGPAVERVVRQAARRGFRFADLAVALALSDPFRVQPPAPVGNQP